MKKSKIIIPILIILAMVFVGFSAYADDSEQITQENDAKILNEIVEKRTLASRAYEMSDGTVKHELFATDIHYEDESGNIKEIDIKVKDIDSAKNNGYKFKNGENDWNIYFADKGKAKDLVEITQDDYSISFSMDNVKSEAKASKSSQMEKGRSELHDYYMEDPTVVMYTDAMKNVDIAYTIREHYLKEDIILNAVPETNEFKFTITTQNLNVTLKDNTLEYNDAKTGENVFYTNNLFMEDSMGKVSTEVSMKLESLKDGKYSLTVIADEKFLNDIETVYPVVIDPTIQNGDTYDVFVASYMPTTNMNSGSTRAPYLRTGKDSPYGIRRSYIRFWNYQIVNAIGSGNMVTSAYFDMYKYSSSGSINLRAYQAGGSWSPSVITWNYQPGTTGSSVSSYYYGSSWYRMNITSWVAGWSTGSITNNGMLIKDTNESSTSTWATFRSSDNWSTDRRPRLVLYTTGIPPTPTPVVTATPAPTATPMPTPTPEFQHYSNNEDYYIISTSWNANDAGIGIPSPISMSANAIGYYEKQTLSIPPFSDEYIINRSGVGTYIFGYWNIYQPIIWEIEYTDTWIKYYKNSSLYDSVFSMSPDSMYLLDPTNWNDYNYTSNNYSFIEGDEYYMEAIVTGNLSDNCVPFAFGKTIIIDD